MAYNHIDDIFTVRQVAKNMGISNREVLAGVPGGESEYAFYTKDERAISEWDITAFAAKDEVTSRKKAPDEHHKTPYLDGWGV